MSTFALIFFAVQFVLVLYLYNFYIRTNTKLSKRTRRLGTAALSASVIVVFSTFLLRLLAEFPLRSSSVKAYHWFALTLMGSLAILVLYSFASDLSTGIHWLWRKARGTSKAQLREVVATDSSRRGFILGAAGASSAMGLGQALAGPKVKEVRVSIQGLPEGLKGLRIVQVSDLHVGPLISRAYVENVVEQVNALQPDLIALTGDFVDGSVEQLRDDVAPLALLRSRYGSFFCSGNHEFYSGLEPWMAEFKRLGMRVLDNRHELLKLGEQTIVVAGVHDISSVKRFPGYVSDPVQAIAGAPKADLRILLAHQPKSVFEAAKAGYDLQLSGHTHAGQFFPFSLFVYFAHPYVKGLNRHDEKLWVYVNQATGYWGPPIRLGIPAEITLLILA